MFWCRWCDRDKSRRTLVKLAVNFPREYMRRAGADEAKRVPRHDLYAFAGPANLSKATPKARVIMEAPKLFHMRKFGVLLPSLCEKDFDAEDADQVQLCRKAWEVCARIDERTCTRLDGTTNNDGTNNVHEARRYHQ